MNENFIKDLAALHREFVRSVIIDTRGHYDDTYFTFDRFMGWVENKHKEIENLKNNNDQDI